MMNKEYTLGTIDLTIEVEFSKSDTSHGGDGAWLSGVATVRGGTQRMGVDELPVGCWTDTDDDHDSWNVSHEGAAILHALTQSVSMRTDDPYTWMEAFPRECEEIGYLVCGALREAVDAEVQS